MTEFFKESNQLKIHILPSHGAISSSKEKGFFTYLGVPIMIKHEKKIFLPHDEQNIITSFRYFLVFIQPFRS